MGKEIISHGQSYIPQPNSSSSNKKAELPNVVSEEDQKIQEHSSKISENQGPLETGMAKRQVEPRPSTSQQQSAARAKIEELMKETVDHSEYTQDPFFIKELKTNIDVYEKELRKEGLFRWIQHVISKILTGHGKDSTTERAIKYCNATMMTPEQKIVEDSLKSPMNVDSFRYTDHKGRNFVFSGQIQDGQLFQGKLIEKLGDKKENTYEGNFRNNKLDGKGTFTDSQGTIYDGTFENNQLNGDGTIKYPDKTIYVGTCKQNKPHGQGKIKYEDGSTYEGEFRNGEPNGMGKMVYEDGTIYAGNFKNGKPHGTGKITYPSMGTFKGTFINGEAIRRPIYKNLDSKHSGKGKIIKMNGTVYEGTFVNGKLEGQGKTTTINGTICEGTFKNNMPIEGTLKYEDGDVFEGTFNDDGPWKGTLTYHNQVRYEGLFEDTEPNGQGKMTFPNGDVFEGEFVDGEFISGTITDKDGTKPFIKAVK